MKMNKIKALSALLSVVLILCVFSVFAFTASAEKVTDNKEAKVITADEAGITETLSWNAGYIAAPNKSGVQAYDYKTAGGCYFTDVIIVAKAGTAVTYTDSSTSYLTSAAYSVSSWVKDANGYWVGDPDGANYFAMAQYTSRVQTPNTSGGIDYKYVTSKDNEAIRLAIRVNSESELPKVTFKLTGEKGTYAQEIEDDRSPVTYNADGTLTGVFWTCGYIGSSTNTNGFAGGINPSSANFAWSSIINIEKAGTAITFTAPKTSNSTSAASNAYVVSHWELKEGAQRYTHVADGVNNCAGNNGADNTLISGDNVYFTEKKNSDGSVTYTYISTKDNENIRICYYTKCDFDKVPETPLNITWKANANVEVDPNEFNAERDFQYKTYQFKQIMTLNYRLYLPKDYDASKSYPMIVFLHGSGERGSDNKAQLKNGILIPFSDPENPIHDCIVVAPQCPTGYKWVSVSSWTNVNYSTDSIQESIPLKATYALLESLKTEYSVDTDRIYATGISMGGFGTWDLLVRHTDMFAAAIPVCGGCDVNYADRLVNVPILTFHGTADPTVPMTGTSAMYDKIVSLGGTKITFTQYQGMNHFIWDKAYAETGLIEWLLSNKLSDRFGNDEEDTTTPEETTTEVPVETTTEIPVDVTTEPAELTTPNVTTNAPADTTSGSCAGVGLSALIAALAFISIISVAVIRKK